MVSDTSFRVINPLVNTSLIDYLSLSDDEKAELEKNKNMASAGATTALSGALAGTMFAGSGVSAMIMLVLVELLKFEAIQYPPNVKPIFDEIKPFPPPFLIQEFFLEI